MQNRVIWLLVATALSCSGGEDKSCTSNNDCPLNEKCVELTCVARCTCALEDECTATAPECLPETTPQDADDETVVCLPCEFDSECNDGFECTKDFCDNGCCSARVYLQTEKVGCCALVTDCIDLMNPLATPEDPDADPCTIDQCLDFQCVHQVEDPLCCHNHTECTDENDCTDDKCVENLCVFSPPRPGCCSKDPDCKDDNTCTLDICVEGECVHPQDSLLAGCKCGANTDCDDANDCTYDSCLEGKCIYDKANASHCCGSSAQCDDQDPTTEDFCKMYSCIHKKLKTCFSDETCDDDDACTKDECDPEEGFCLHIRTDNPYCCNLDGDCDDENHCTTGVCKDNLCQFKIIEGEGCCKQHVDCDDGIGCTIDECDNWKCHHTPVGAKCCTPESADTVCNDGNPCTIDECDNGLCKWTPSVVGCCEVHSDCLDCIDLETGASCQVDHTVNPPKCIGANCVDNVCTEHQCSDQFCYYYEKPNCCLADSKCDDSNPCTEDTCNAQNKCEHTMDALCCASNGMCNDGDICTIDVCNIPSGSDKGICEHEEKPDCCKKPDDCVPQTCKNVYCQNGNCIYVQKENCCIHDEECDDDDICTIDKCTDSVCTHIPSGVCE